MSNHHIQRLTSSLMTSLSQNLGRANPGQTLDALEKSYPKLAKAMQTYKECDSGLYYRGLGNARIEQSRLRYNQNTSVSATLITQTPVNQPLYRPRYTDCVGVLIMEPSKIRAISDTLFIKTPEGQSPEEIQQTRHNIVQKLKLGHLQGRIDTRSGIGIGRQVAVNESLIDYTKDQIAALVVPGTAFQEQTDNRQSYQIKGLSTARVTAQLGYLNAKLGDLPIVSFNGVDFDVVRLSETQWRAQLEFANGLASHPKTTNLLQSETDGYQPYASGLQQAMAETQSLEHPLDIHEMKHVGGAFTQVPTDITRYLLGFKS